MRKNKCDTVVCFYLSALLPVVHFLCKSLSIQILQRDKDSARKWTRYNSKHAYFIVHNLFPIPCECSISISNTQLWLAANNKLNILNFYCSLK